VVRLWCRCSANRERERKSKKGSTNQRRKDTDSRNAVRTYLRRRCSDRRAAKEERTEMFKIQNAARGVALTTQPHRAARLQKRWSCTSSPSSESFGPFKGELYFSRPCQIYSRANSASATEWKRRV